MAQLPLPRLADLGDDLTGTTRFRRYAAVAVPLLFVTGYACFAWAGWWSLAVGCVMGYTFFSYGSTSHDLVHGNLGFGPRENAFWLSLVELLGLRSGHAYCVAHVHHHARFPHPDDIQGEAAGLSFWRAVASGPFHSLRVHAWAFRSARRLRARILTELALCLFLLAATVVATHRSYAPAIYVALVLAGGWTFPLVTA